MNNLEKTTWEIINQYYYHGISRIHFNNMSVCLSVSLSISLSVCQSVYQSVCQSVYQSVCIYVYLSVCLSVCLSIYLSDNRLSICLSLYICLFACPPVYLSMPLPISASTSFSRALFACLLSILPLFLPPHTYWTNSYPSGIQGSRSTQLVAPSWRWEHFDRMVTCTSIEKKRKKERKNWKGE